MRAGAEEMLPGQRSGGSSVRILLLPGCSSMSEQSPRVTGNCRAWGELKPS